VFGLQVLTWDPGEWVPLTELVQLSHSRSISWWLILHMSHQCMLLVAVDGWELAPCAQPATSLSATARILQMDRNGERKGTSPCPGGPDACVMSTKRATQCPGEPNACV